SAGNGGPDRRGRGLRGGARPDRRSGQKSLQTVGKRESFHRTKTARRRLCRAFLAGNRIGPVSVHGATSSFRKTNRYKPIQFGVTKVRNSKADSATVQRS